MRKKAMIFFRLAMVFIATSLVNCPMKLTAVQPGCCHLTYQRVYFPCPSHFVVTSVLSVYLCYLIFQLASHKTLYDEHNSAIADTVRYTGVMAKRLRISGRSLHHASSPPPHWQSNDVGSLEAGPKEDDDETPPLMGMSTTIALLGIVTVVC